MHATLCKAAAVAGRRMRSIVGSVPPGRDGGRPGAAHLVKPLSITSAGDTVKIGEISRRLKTPRNPELVPVGHVPPDSVPQTVARHLRWILQKDLLGQDVFLMGAPGPLRRSVAMQYLELTRREVEYVALSRDTTEADLKQRREIRSGTAFYADQPAVRAATEGRVLVLEGLEKAERNVLPVLNNLLENREMQLEDGRFLVSAERYDRLLRDHTEDELDARKIVRVSEDFRVFALGLPVPKYRGNPLDPPLRSRFQVRDVGHLPLEEQAELLLSSAAAAGPHVTAEKVSRLLSAAATLCSRESSAMGLPDFPVDRLPSALRLLNAFPAALSSEQLFQRLYPYQSMLGKEGRAAVEGVLGRFELLDAHRHEPAPIAVVAVAASADNESHADVTLRVGDDKDVTFQVPAGTKEPRRTPNSSSPPTFIGMASHARLLAEMMQSHMVGDVCLIGARGCGKSAVAREFGEMLGYNAEPVMLYPDMTARDLLQQRYTLPNRDTAWRASPLVGAAREGKLLVLDGIHRLDPGTLSVLSTLLHDRELSLYDGTRLLRWDRYRTLKEQLRLSDQQLQERSVFPVHPSFRVLALAEPPLVGAGGGSSGGGASGQRWLNPEILTMFFYHSVTPLAKAEELSLIRGLIPNVPPQSVQQLLQLSHSLRNASDPTGRSLASSLSTRQLLRICRRLSAYPEESVARAVNKACLSRFLPSLARASLQKSLADCSIRDAADPAGERGDHAGCTVKDGVLTIGSVSAPIFKPEETMKVPDVLFYDNAQHVAVMEDMLKDFLLGEHLLLIGNQGVGKNKIVDRFLHLLNRPREYLQLHRDTTVQTLTLQPSVRDGVIVYEDSPLVKAVKLGHVLVIDEADKAPTNVTCILKTLVESGEMILADGRRIVSDPLEAHRSPNIIAMHPDFRMVVLANRPGFPFLGNDFFGALGDIFSCHAVDNPKPRSELAMLKRYGPDVPDATLQKLVAAFGELRSMADQGTITYPYSTREVVGIVKHLQRFPYEGLAEVVRNVFDFESYNKDTREVLTETLRKHGIPFGADENTKVIGWEDGRPVQITVERDSGKDVTDPKHGKIDPENEPHVGGNQWAGGTGGRDTAGLGGKGGPYRLDAGHTVHQVSQAEKDAVPDEVRRAAREMAEKAFKERLREIDMSEYDAATYGRFSGAVRRQVASLRAILDNLEARGTERRWLKNQAAGELDDAKIIDGLTGERAVYKRRGEPEEPDLPGGPGQRRPKRLRLLVDVSGSMYRFNGLDGRLDRSMEAVCLLMEALRGYEHKVRYDVVGHSGDGYDIPLVGGADRGGQPPGDDKARLKVLQTMRAHSQFCRSGDHTLEATRASVRALAREVEVEGEAGERFVVVLSDANLERYGVRPERLARALTSEEPRVGAFVVFIGSLGDQAERLQRALPAGRAFVAMDTEQIPQILQQIFTSAVLSSDA